MSMFGTDITPHPPMPEPPRTTGYITSADHHKKIGCVQHDCDECQKRIGMGGKTLRDEIAIEAMKCALNALAPGKTNRDIAIGCYDLADKMLETRGGAA